MKKSILLILVPLFLFSENYSLSPMEQKSIEMAKKWINNNSKIERQKDGSLAFYYGDNMPSVICKPLNATIIKLGEGEVYKSLRTGDTDRWKFDVVENATDDRTFILIKPTKSNIMTNLIIFTNKRIYNIKLISSSSNWTPSISFIYDDGSSKTKKSNSSTQVFNTPPVEDIKPPIKKNIKAKKVKLSKYIIKSNGTWKPDKIFTKKGKTYIHIGNEKINNIRLYLMNKNNSKTIKYTYSNKYLVVNAIIKKAVLIKDDFTKTVINIRRKK